MKPKFAVIDADIHPVVDARRVQALLAEPWRTRYAAGNRGPGSLGYWNVNGVMRPDAVLPDGSRIEASPQALARHVFDAYGLDYGVFNPSNTLQIALSPETPYAAAVLSAINHVLVDEWLPTDPRFRTSLTVSPADPELAAQEIHRLGDAPGVVQVLMPSAAPMPYGHRFYHPIYAAAVEHGLPVAIHPGSEGVGIHGAPSAVGYPSSYLEWHTGLVATYIGHLISLVTEGVFVKFPTLRFVLVEGGVFWLPPLLWRLDKNWKGLRQTTPWLERPPSEYVREHIRLTTQPLEEPERAEHFRAMLATFDAEKMLLFSSDFPHWDGDTPDFAARAFPAEMRARVMSENARALYRLPPTTPAEPEPVGVGGLATEG